MNFQTIQGVTKSNLCIMKERVLMRKIMISPSKYVQGKNVLHSLGEWVENFGKKALLVASKQDLSYVEQDLQSAQNKIPFQVVYGDFGGECTSKEIERLRKIVAEQGCDVIIGLGGGKALDTAKATSHFENLPVIIVPTIASTDAPCSSLAVIYTEEGAFESYLFFKNNPNLVLVDTQIIAKAPVRFLVAGMGDALSTYFEARSCAQSRAKNIPGGLSTQLAIAAAELCYQTLLKESTKAKAACECGVVTEALENIVEANILLSGIGFESSGLAAAHAVHNGLTALDETHHYFHGEKVAFGVLVHLLLENASIEEIQNVLAYCHEVGLPIHLGHLGITDKSEDKLMAVAKLACAEGETIHNMPFEVTVENVYAAIMAADRMGVEYEKNNQ